MSTHTETTTTAASPTTPRTAPRSLLRTALRLDAGVTGANGAAYLIAAEPLGDLLGLAPSLLRGSGAFLLVFAGLVWLTAAPRSMSRTAVGAILAANALWAIASIVAASADWGSPTTVGTVWVLLQALVVAGFAALQLTGPGRAKVASQA